MKHFAVLLRSGLVMIRVYHESVDALTLVLDCKEYKSYPVDHIYSFYLHGLKPNRVYNYSIKHHPVHGSFKTPGGRDVHFRLMSCFGDRPEQGLFPSQPIDFNLIVGDAIYGDQHFPSTTSKLERWRAAITKEEYKEIYRRKFFEVDQIQTALKDTLNIFVADDHELFDDWQNFFRSFQYSPLEMQLATNVVYTMYALGSPSTVAPPPPMPAFTQDQEHVLWSVESPDYIRSKANGLEAFRTHLNPERRYFSFKQGDCEFFVLDINTERTPMKINDNAQVLSIMSDRQMKWLLKGLKNSKCDIKFIVTSQGFSDNIIVPRSPIVPQATKLSFTELYHLLVLDPNIHGPLLTLNGAFPPALDMYNGLDQEGKFRIFGKAMSLLNAAGWMYYDKQNTVSQIPQTNKQRNQIIDFIREQQIDHVIFLTGDLHTSYVGYVDDLRSGAFPLIEIAGTPNGSVPEQTVPNYMEDHPEQKQYVHAVGEKNYVEIHADKKTVTVKFIKENSTDTVTLDLNKYRKLQRGQEVTGVLTVQ